MVREIARPYFFRAVTGDCRYCHNPETREYVRRPYGPRAGLSCVERFKMKMRKVRFFPERCVGCDTCIKTCRFGSSPRICNLTPEQTFEQIKKQIPFISGVTVSGGECSLYCEFVESLFKLCKEVV